MRIHTSLTHWQMRQALQASGAPIDFEVLEQHASRTHDRAFEVMLSGTGGRPAFRNSDFQAATWDEWGAFFGALYTADPKARCGGSAKHPTYRDAEHYHFVTGERFRPRFDVAGEGNYLPIDTHRLHRWTYGDGDTAGFHCTKCSATRPSWQQVEAYAPRSYA